MKITDGAGIDAYRIGYGCLARVAVVWRVWRAGYSLAIARSQFVNVRRSSDRWRRGWQAEWAGCRRAPRAWTRRGVIRKGARWAAR